MNKFSGIKYQLIKWYYIIIKMFSYNLKIIFGSRFIWFLLSSVGFFIFLVIIQLFSENSVFSAEGIYAMLFFPGILLVFYPTTFGIQNDIDTRMLEILFGIPDYRYKVWLVRMVIIYVITFIIMMILSYLSSWLLTDFSPIRMVYHLMFPIFFLGCLGFGISTLAKNGYGTAVIMVVIGIFFLILQEPLEGSKWTIFLNPFDIPSGINQSIWRGIVMWNRIYLVIGMILTVLLGLLRLQQREKFM